jgi:hypothetical protein
LRTVKDELQGSNEIHCINAEDVYRQRKREHQQHEEDDDVVSINTNQSFHYEMVKKDKGKTPCNRPWRPIGL